MPSKSKRNRRPPVRKMAVVAASNNTLVDQTVIDTAAGSPRVERTPAVAANISKTADLTTGAQFMTELKWIGIVTVIIAVLLVASYYIFK